ncbi:hypothetical protein CR513_39269, partial [Mucuna pruriens]
MLDRLGFSEKWRGWVRGCIFTSQVYILLNDSPTDEIRLSKGLKLGLRANSSHRCFKLVSCLKVNFHKSKLVGCYFSHCSTGSIPFKFLGIPVEANPRLISTWQTTCHLHEKQIGILEGKTSFFGSLPLYLLSFFKLPKKVLKVIISIQRSFLESGKDVSHKIPWIWSLVTGVVRQKFKLKSKLYLPLVRKVRDRKHVSLWHDIWIGTTPLKDFSDDKDAFIVDMGEWINNKWCWKWNSRREFFVWEQETLLEFSNLLSNTSLMFAGSHNTLIGIFNKLWTTGDCYLTDYPHVSPWLEEPYKSRDPYTTGLTSLSPFPTLVSHIIYNIEG